MTEATPLASEQITDPAGWKLVPIEPTQEMIDAWAGASVPAFLVAACPDDEANRIVATNDWKAMLAASPAPSGQGVSGTLANPSTFGKPTFGLDAAVAPSCAPGEVERFVIRRNGAFFRPNAAGYTNHVVAAGFYSREEADSYASIEGVTIEPLERYRADAERTIAEAKRFLAALSPQGLDAKEGCWACNGDCGSANPPVIFCPMRDAKPAAPSQRLDAATVERCAQVAESLRGDALYSPNQYGTAGKIADAIRALATEPHQHGGKGA